MGIAARPGQQAVAVDITSKSSAAAALRTFFNVAEQWGLTNEQQQCLLGCSRTTFFAWRRGTVKAGLGRDTLERLSHVFGIYSALQILLPDKQRAAAWISKPNAAPLFGGGSALDRMLGGQVADLYTVRQYLDAQRGGWA
jgi:hypothetical protein